MNFIHWLSESNQTNDSLRTELAKSELKLESNQNYVDEVKAKQESLESRNTDLQSENQNLMNQVTKLSTQLDGANYSNDLLKERTSDFESKNNVSGGVKVQKNGGLKLCTSFPFSSAASICL